MEDSTMDPEAHLNIWQAERGSSQAAAVRRATARWNGPILSLRRHFAKRSHGARRLRRFRTKSAGESLHLPPIFGDVTLKRPEDRAPDTQSVAVVLFVAADALRSGTLR